MRSDFDFVTISQFISSLRCPFNSCVSGGSVFTYNASDAETEAAIIFMALSAFDSVFIANVIDDFLSNQSQPYSLLFLALKR
jgi:hypothetical protein